MDVSGVESDTPSCPKTHWATPGGETVHWEDDANNGQGGHVLCGLPGWHFVIPEATQGAKIGDTIPAETELTALHDYGRNRPPR